MHRYFPCGNCSLASSLVSYVSRISDPCSRVISGNFWLPITHYSLLRFAAQGLFIRKIILPQRAAAGLGCCCPCRPCCSSELCPVHPFSLFFPPFPLFFPFSLFFPLFFPFSPLPPDRGHARLPGEEEFLAVLHLRQ